MEENNKQQQKTIDLGKIANLLWTKKMTFVKVWVGATSGVSV